MRRIMVLCSVRLFSVVHVSMHTEAFLSQGTKFFLIEPRGGCALLAGTEAY